MMAPSVRAAAAASAAPAAVDPPAQDALVRTVRARERDQGPAQVVDAAVPQPEEREVASVPVLPAPPLVAVLVVRHAPGGHPAPIPLPRWRCRYHALAGGRGGLAPLLGCACASGRARFRLAPG